MRKLSLAIPKPCRSSWEGMIANENSRFCDSCGKAVHDLSALTRREADALIHSNPNGFCARIGYDATGNILFRREPAGRLVSISLLGASALAAQTQSDSKACRLDVNVTDVTGARVPGAVVEVAGGPDPRRATTGADGTARYDLPAGEYRLVVSAPGFAQSPAAKVSVSCDKPAVAGVQLQLGVMVGEVVVVSNMSLRQRAWFSTRTFFHRMLSSFEI